MVSKQEPAVQQVDVERLSEAELAEWTALHQRQGFPANPFCSPLWVRAWYRSFVPDPTLRHLLFVRDTTGALVGVAPLYTDVVGRGPLRARRLTLVASGRHTPMELPQVLTAPGTARQVHADVVAHCLQAPADWTELTLDRDQAWFEPAWVQSSTAPVPFYGHHRVRACVILPLEGTWEQLKSSRKRNLKESLRRGRNRLEKSGLPWEVRTLAGADLDEAAIDRFFALHSQRSTFGGSTSTHGDAYADTRIRAFLRGLLPELAAAGEASIIELRVGGVVAATQLALHAARCSYVHSSGMDPDYWDYSPVTLLQAQVVIDAIGRGDEVVNFSPGPNVAKMRWSERMHVLDDFTFATADVASGVRYAAFTQLSSFNQWRRGVAIVRSNSPQVLPAEPTGLPALARRALSRARRRA
ncbi:hypothetical protein NUM3379_03050 [Kineococcus sp. NUM-3379]